MAITLALVDDDPAVRERVRATAACDDTLALVAEFADARSAIDWLADHAVDVLLVDLGLPDLPGAAVIASCAERHPGTDILVLSVFDDADKVLECVAAGASGYLLKDGTDGLADAIRQVRAGGAPMTPTIARRLLGRLRPGHGVETGTDTRVGTASAATAAPRAMAPATASGPRPVVAEFRLTPAESNVLQLVARGFKYAEIAQLSGVTVNTVHTHIRNIYGKLSVSSRSEAVFEASRLGLLDDVFPPGRPATR